MNKFYLDSEKTALFLIDIQERMLPAIYQHEKLIKPTNTLITVAEAFDLPIYITEQYPQGLGGTVDEFEARLSKLKVNKWSKTSFSACLPPIMEQISKDKVDTIIIAGIEAHICVFQTTRDLLKLGFNVQIAADTVGSRDPNNKKIALELMSDLGAVISNSETMAYDLLKDSKVEQFKAISNAVK